MNRDRLGDSGQMNRIFKYCDTKKGRKYMAYFRELHVVQCNYIQCVEVVDR